MYLSPLALGIALSTWLVSLWTTYLLLVWKYESKERLPFLGIAHPFTPRKRAHCTPTLADALWRYAVGLIPGVGLAMIVLPAIALLTILLAAAVLRVRDAIRLQFARVLQHPL
jgi:hypothetical protein